MSTNVEKIEGNKVKLTFTVPSDDFDKALDQAFKKVSKEVSVPGFRKGKIPRQMFEKKFGVESLYQDALDIVLPHAYMNAIQESDISPIDQPEIDVESIEQGEDVVLTATVEVEPEVKLGDYKDLEVELLNAEVSDEDIQAEIDKLLEQHAEMIVKEEGEVQDGDLVNLNFEGFLGDAPFEGGQAEDYELTIGSDSFIPGFEDQLVGMNVEDEGEVNVTFPEDYHAEELAGKDAMFKVKINSIKAKTTPEIDEALLKELDYDVTSKEELREAILKDLTEKRELERDNKMREDLVVQASENAEVDIPNAMVKTESDKMLQEFKQNLQQQGLDFETYTKFSGQDENALRKQMEDDAKKRVKTQLTLKQIVTDEGIEVTDEDIDAELEKLAAQFNMGVDDIKKALGDTAVLSNDLKLQRAVDFLVDNRKK